MADLTPEALAARIVQLENQVKDLADTVAHLKASHESNEQSKPAAQAARDQAIAKHRALRFPAAKPASKPVEVSTAEPYKYSPLKQNSAEVRIMGLKASSDPAAPIQCRLIVVDLDDAPNLKGSVTNPGLGKLFTPLSYTWGDVSVTKLIYVDGKTLRVTRSLYNALLYFRKVNDNIPQRRRIITDETFWWIDAICINQQDLDERSHQVTLMTRLYRLAKLVNVWLGEESEDSALAMRLVRQLGYSPSIFEDVQSWQYIRKPGQTHRPAGPGLPDVKLPPEPPEASQEEKKANCKALVSLFRRPWFVRVWIRQEISLSEDVKVHYGDEECTWNQLMRTAHLLSFLADDHGVGCLQPQKSLDHTSLVSCFQAATWLDETRNSTSGGRNYVSFKNLAFLARDCQSTDARDKVYAMLPLSNPDEIPIVADYRKALPDAYEAALVPLLEKSLNVLAACENPYSRNKLPSWIPDFSQPWKAQPLWPFLSRERHVRDHDFRNGLPEIVHNQEKHTLSVLGILLDDIERIHPTHAQADHSDESLKELIEAWWEFSQDKRKQLIDDMVKRKATMKDYPFLNSGYDKTVWDMMCLDANWDVGSRKRVDSDNEVKPMKGRKLADDPTFRRAMNLVVYDKSATSIEADTSMAHFRRMAIGRQAAMSVKGLVGLIPMDAEIGDKMAYIKGSDIAYILRHWNENEFRVVGQSYLMCQPNLEGLEVSHKAQMLTLI